MRLRVTVLVLVTALVAVAVAPQPAEGLDVSGSFVDDDGNFHETAIEAIAAEGITLGCGGRNYCPATSVTRAQMASFLVRAFDLPPGPGGQFTDTAGSLHEADIDALAAAGITLGCAPGRYCPEAPVRRDEMASFLVRALGLAAVDGDRFTDIGGSSHAGDINALAVAGITQGCAPGLYCPTAAVRRDQMATFLLRSLELTPLPPRLPLGEVNATCSKDGMECNATGSIPYRPQYRISEGFYNVMPFQGSEQAELSSTATRVEVFVDGAAVGLTPQPMEESGDEARRVFTGTVTLAPGHHLIVTRWYWDGELVRTTRVSLQVNG